MMNIELSYELQPHELRRALNAIARRRRIILWAASIVLLVLGVTFLTLDSDHGLDFLSSLCVGVGVMYVLMLTLGTRMGVKKQAARLCTPTQLLLTANEFTVETDLERGEFKWAAIIKIRETSEVFLLHRSARLAIVIPKRAFDREQLTEFSAFVAGRGVAPSDGAPAAGTVSQ